MVKITRKVISKKVTTEAEVETEVKVVKVETEGKPKKVCQFCKDKNSPSYTDTNLLRRFITDRAKITPRAKSYLCSKHQRGVAKEIKYARHLSLLPFTPKI